MNPTLALQPKQAVNLKLAGALAILLLAFYLGGAYFWPFSPKHGIGLIFGTLATLAFVFSMAYPWRRPRARPLGSAQRWLQAHVYLAALGQLCVFLHTGFRLPRGVFGWTLLLLSLWTTFTGLLGVWLQKWIPVAMTEGLRVEALYERIPELVDELRKEAEALVAGASDVLERFYRSEVSMRLAGVTPSWSYLFDVRSGRERALEGFQRIGQFVDEAEKETVADLSSIVAEKLELDAQYTLQGLLRRWLLLHVPPAALLIALLAVHVFAWVWY